MEVFAVTVKVFGALEGTVIKRFAVSIYYTIELALKLPQELHVEQTWLFT